MPSSSSQRMIRRAWYFREQRAMCCLQETDGCKQRKGLMQFALPSNTPGYATVEHLMPRSLIGKHKPKTHVILLACRECNNAKGDRVAAPRMLEIAALFREKYLAFARELEKGRRDARSARKLEVLTSAAQLGRAHTAAAREDYLAAGMVKPKGRAA